MGDGRLFDCFDVTCLLFVVSFLIPLFVLFLHFIEEELHYVKPSISQTIVFSEQKHFRGMEDMMGGACSMQRQERRNSSERNERNHGVRAF